MSKRKASILRAEKMKVVYVAGPYTAATEELKQVNIRMASITARELWANGCSVICPHLNTRDFELAPETSSLSHNVWIEGDLAIIARCDAVVLLPGWEGSHGARQEVLYALQKGKPVYHSQRMEELWQMDISASRRARYRLDTLCADEEKE